MRSLVGSADARAARPAPRFTRTRLIALVVVLAVAVVAGYFAYDRFLKPQPAATPAAQATAVTRGSVVASVSSTGSVIAAQTADLSFGASGRLTELKVSVGQTVKKGEVLARLDTTDFQLDVLKAEAQLATAESNLAKLEAGSTSAEIAQARAQLKSAQASFDKARAGATAVDLQSAEASVATARVQLQKAEDALVDLKAGPTVEAQTTAKIAIEKARIALQNAQAAYDKIAWKANAAATTEAMTLWQATTDYQSAELAYNKAMAGPTQSELNIAEQTVLSAKAAVASAEAKLATLQQGATEAELASAEASVLQAQNQLETKLNPSTSAEKQAARASVEQAKVAVQSAKANLEKATIVAPFDGAVSVANGSVGQTISGTVVTLLDVSAPQVQITLPETDVAKVEPGQQATVTFEALGGAQLLGKVTSISPKATVSSGVATYTAYLSVESLPQRAQGGQGAPAGQQGATQGTTGQQGQPAPGTLGQVPSTQGSQGQGARPSGAGAAARVMVQAADITKVRPGMTASVSIVYLRKDNVLTVPNRAVKAQGQARVVDVLVEGKTETRTVTVGAADDQRTEIVSGLAEGEQVLVTTTTTTTTSSQGGVRQGATFVVPATGPGGFPGR